MKILSNSIGIFGGSFDPPHYGHVKISRISLEKIGIKQIYWIVTKKNPFKKKTFFSLSERILKSKKIDYKFDYSIKDRMIDRVFKDDTFKKRQGIAALLAIFCRSIYIDKLMFNILKIPFPYMKLIIKK